MKVTEYLAIYEALLSTFVFFWNIRRATPRIKVDVVFGIDEINGEHTPGAYIPIKNPSAHTVHLAHISILYPYREVTKYELLKHTIKYKRLPLYVGWVHSSLSNFDVKDGCPLELEPGKSHGILFPEKPWK